MFIIRFIKSLYFSDRIFYVGAILVFVFALGFFIPVFFNVAQAGLLTLAVVTIIDIVMLYSEKTGLKATRSMTERLSNGDPNPIVIRVENWYPFFTYTEILDEIPEQFQYREKGIPLNIPAKTYKEVVYELRPVKRGEYTFGYLNVYASTLAGLVRRRYKIAAETTVPVYPSYIQMQKYELLAISNKLTISGIKKIRRIGHNFEFDQIRDYVSGDDFRTINWKATARRGELMVNQYQDEKSQQVYSIIDKGRVMKMPFEGLSLLDYAINAALVISNIAIKKYDKAGLVTFTEENVSILKAERKPEQINKILNTLYNQKTRYLESSFELLYSTIKQKINQRSLILFYTNFESITSLTRRINYFKAISKYHLLVVIFFENTELDTLIQSNADTLEQAYIKTIAEKMIYEKKQMVAELAKYGIQSILTAPKDLSVNTINKYLELKARGLI